MVSVRALRMWKDDDVTNAGMATGILIQALDVKGAPVIPWDPMTTIVTTLMANVVANQELEAWTAPFACLVTGDFHPQAAQVRLSFWKITYFKATFIFPFQSAFLVTSQDTFVTLTQDAASALH